MDAPQYFKDFYLPPPRTLILKRLGYNVHKTAIPQEQARTIDATIAEAASVCVPSAALLRVPLELITQDVVRLAGLPPWESRGLAEFLDGSTSVAIIGATVGEAVTLQAQAAIEAGNGSRAALFDAVGSEMADAALGWVHEYAARTYTRTGHKVSKMRFSPGYSDFHLAAQRDIFETLGMKSLEVRLTPSLALDPEKSVLAVAGIRKTG